LEELPQGEQIFAGVNFKVGDAYIQLAGKVLTAIGELPNLPERVEGIKVNRSFTRLYILHANQWGNFREVVDGTIIGHYVVHYEDGSVETIPIVQGENVRDWWEREDQAVTRGTVAWRGYNRQLRVGRSVTLRLYLAWWYNPHPDKQVDSIDFMSTKTTAAAPFCVAMTVEEPLADRTNP
jgi:beta-galactosidase